MKPKKETRGRKPNLRPTKSINLTFQADEYKEIQKLRQKLGGVSDAHAAKMYLKGQ